MASLSVIVAAYGSFAAARSDWDEVQMLHGTELNLVDAALIERSDDRVVTVHRCSPTGWGQGTVACALVGALWPPALLDGAIAGGVGGRVLTLVSKGLSRDAVNELGRMMESGRFVTLAITDRGPNPATNPFGSRALGVATLPMTGTAYDLRRAVETDESDA